MRQKIIEATNQGGLYLKALIGRFSTADWERRAMLWGTEPRPSLLRNEGWTNQHFLILDLSHGSGGAMFMFGGVARIDVNNAPAVL